MKCHCYIKHRDLGQGGCRRISCGDKFNKAYLCIILWASPFLPLMIRVSRTMKSNAFGVSPFACWFANAFLSNRLPHLPRRQFKQEEARTPCQPPQLREWSPRRERFCLTLRCMVYGEGKQLRLSTCMCTHSHTLIPTAPYTWAIQFHGICHGTVFF